MAARVKYGALITQMKGNLNGMTLQTGHTVEIIRTRKAAPYKGSHGGKSLRAIATAATLWADLSDADRLTWTTAALSWPFKDKFGTVYYGNPYQVFIAYNAGLQLMGNDPVSAAEAAASAQRMTSFALDLSLSDGFFASWDSTITVHQNIFIWMSQPSKAGRNTTQQKMSLISTVDMNGIGGTPVTSPYEQKFGTPPVGSTIYWSVGIRLKQFPQLVQIAYGSTVVRD